jgi:hypothetical protein
LTVAAIQAGYTAWYRSAFDLAQDLAEAEATGTRPELIRKLTRVDLLVIEDLGMRRLPPIAAEDLLQVFTRRYETGAILLSSDRPLEDWAQVLGDTAAAGALLDRFLHHADIIRLQGRSCRVHDRQRHRTPDTANGTLPQEQYPTSSTCPSVAAFDMFVGGRLWVFGDSLGHHFDRICPVTPLRVNVQVPLQILSRFRFRYVSID